MVTIIPAILTDNINEIREKLKMLEGVVDRVQIDIIDGMFADNKTIFPDVLESIDTSLAIDFHLMTKEPIDWIERCARGMADRIIGQVEQMSDQEEFVGKVQEVGAKVGLAIDLETPTTAVDTLLLPNLDVVVVMSVPAGFGGQAFNALSLPKLKYLDEIRVRDDTPFRLCVDGGINETTIEEAVRAGADEVAVGTHLFSGDIKNAIQTLQHAAYGASTDTNE